MKDQPTKPDLDSLNSAYVATLQQLEEKREEWRSYLTKAETLKKAIHAAQSEAEAAKAQWRERFHDSGGAITPEVKRLRKENREAADLVEEYVLLHDEMLPALETRKLALAEAANACLKARRQLANAVRDTEIVKLAASCGPAIRKVGALFRAEFDDFKVDRFSPGYTDDPNELDQRFFRRLASAIGPCDQQDAAPILAPLDLSDVDLELTRSPMRQMALRARLSTRQPAA